MLAGDSHYSEPWTGDYRAFVDRCQREVRKHWREVREPGSDAFPAIIMHREGRLHVQMVPDHWMASGATKAALITEVVVPLIKTGVTKVAMSSAAWATRPGTPAALELDRLQEAGAAIPWFPELGEGVVEEAVITVQDAERNEFWRAFITRSERIGPQVGRFELVEGRPDVVSGAWVDPIREAMR